MFILFPRFNAKRLSQLSFFLRDREGERANRRGDQSLRLCQSTTLSNHGKVEGDHRYNCMVEYI